MGVGSVVGERLFSPYWYRVAELRPRLREHIQVHRHVYRGERWFVLEDRVGGGTHRFGKSANFVIERLDGSRSVAEIWESALEYLGDEAPNQNAMITLLAQLDGAGAIVCDVTPDTRAIFERHAKHLRSQRASRFKNPLYMKFPLWDPDMWLDRWYPAVRPLFQRRFHVLWAALLLWAGFGAWRSSGEFVEYGRQALAEPRSWVLMVLLYPVVKVLHELGHAFTAKHSGAPVHEIGVMLILGMPVPYVDASATSAFPSKGTRMAVAAAGIGVEVVLASLACV
ncbi:MAG: hypothetical protein HKP27_03880, partial [Myxococcales bacterium]|nr:hypothetical protein [Myxococcales bacterium]